MPVQNVEAMREMYEAFNRGDFERATALLHPEAELHQIAEMPDPDSYYGREGFQKGLTAFTQEWDRIRFEPKSIRELSDGRVLMEISLEARGKRSGAETQWDDLFHLWTVEEGMPRRCEVYLGLEKALEAAGLRE
jgi:ketosteroid isomerase-like protein